MIIALMGTQCVGKTTTLRGFLDRHPEYAESKTSYRDFIKEKGLKINREGNCESQRIILDLMVDDFRQSRGRNDIIIDRTVMDAFIYGLWHFINNIKDSGYSKPQILEQFEIMFRELEGYDHIFFIPLAKNDNIPVIADGLRDTDEEYRWEIDRLFNKTIRVAKDLSDLLGRRFNITPIWGTTEERIALMEKTIA